MSDSLMASCVALFLQHITDGTPAGHNGLVQALLARRSVNSASQTILSHMGRTISATGKTKVLIRKVRFAG